MGNENGMYINEKPAHKLFLEAFYVSKYPVTNSEYQRYRIDVGLPFEFLEGEEEHPVVNVTWFNAREYAAWAGMRLLTEAEWEKAASLDASSSNDTESRVTDEVSSGRIKRLYPWGDDCNLDKCNTINSEIKHTTPVTRYSPASNSPYGCADMAGNVWEWTSSAMALYPYKAEDGRERYSSHEKRVLRGGSWFFPIQRARCTARIEDSPDSAMNHYGFRCGFTRPKNRYES